MSKAKELAREVISQMEEIQRQVMNNNCLSGFTKDWQSGFNHAMIELRNRLNDAVLSEPEPLKGWIEIGETPYRQLLHLYSGKIFEEYAERVRVQGYGGYIDQNISFDDFKAKIREAS